MINASITMWTRTYIRAIVVARRDKAVKESTYEIFGVSHLDIATIARQPTKDNSHPTRKTLRNNTCNQNKVKTKNHSY